MSTSDWIPVLLATVATTIGLAALFSTYERLRRSRYDVDLNRVELEMMRRSTETQLNELTRRLLATESRWRDANHLLIDSQTYQESGTRDSDPQLVSFLQNAGLTQADLQQDPKLVFVLTPFNPQFDATYDLIEEVCRDLGLQALRGDEEYVAHDILRHILSILVRARLVIANIDGRNPNVFYELGIAHALNKPTILISTADLESLPFDLRSRKVLIANEPDKLRELLAREITRSLV